MFKPSLTSDRQRFCLWANYLSNALLANPSWPAFVGISFEGGNGDRFTPKHEVKVEDADDDSFARNVGESEVRDVDGDFCQNDNEGIVDDADGIIESPCQNLGKDVVGEYRSWR